MDYPVTLSQRDRVLKDIESTLAKGQVGAVMAESIQGDADIHIPASGFFLNLH